MSFRTWTITLLIGLLIYVVIVLESFTLIKTVLEREYVFFFHIEVNVHGLNQHREREVSVTSQI